MNTISHKGIFIREGTYDRQIINEVRTQYGPLGIQPDDKVLDVGACFGAFTVHALHMGASVWAFEPEPGNYQLLERNVASQSSPLHKLHQAALTEDGRDVSLYLANGTNLGTHRLRPTRGREALMVRSYAFQAVLDEFQPDIIKMDCEGAEYELLQKPLPSFVKQLAIEIHLNGPDYRSNGRFLVGDLTSQGFVPVKPVIVGVKNWTCQGVFKR